MLKCRKHFLIILLFLLFSLSFSLCPLPVFAETVRESFQEVAKSFLEGDYSRAIKSSWRLREEFPHSQYAIEAKYLAGLAYLKLKGYKKAEKIFKDLCKARHSKDKFYLGLANSYYLQEDWERALSVLQEALRRFPSTELKGVIYFRLGRCKQKKGEWGAAKYYFTKLVQEFPLGLEAKEAKKILEEGEFYFTVQLGAFTDKQNAQRVKYQLIQQGYPAYISVLEKEWQRFYRLRVGRFGLRQEAEVVKKNLEKEGYKPRIYP
ncbi:MAG: hypothetical protein B5M48_02930 [Candidatus Omnitrophica bacterium 4484_213]|nr:MAG: hypothetical protein B5M48_02930 [Candidatus Omnitrophica bacterium 4484_213]